MLLTLSRLRATVMEVVRLEVARERATAAATRHRSDRSGEAHLVPPLPSENVLDLTSDKSIIATLWCLRTLDTKAVPATITGE